MKVWGGSKPRTFACFLSLMKNIVDLTRIMVLSFNDSNTERCQEMDWQAVGSEEPNAETESTSGPSSPLQSQSPVPFGPSFLKAEGSNVGILLMPGVLHIDDTTNSFLKLPAAKSPPNTHQSVSSVYSAHCHHTVLLPHFHAPNSPPLPTLVTPSHFTKSSSLFSPF